jgi:tetratricopeptide (TPR) repeat protein
VLRLQQNPDDTETLAVLSDQLCQRGEPQGELIALSLAGLDGTAQAEGVRRDVLGPVAPALSGAQWRRGFLSRFTLSTRLCANEGLDPCEVLRAVLVHPAAALLETVALSFGNTPAQAGVDHQTAALRSLALLPEVMPPNVTRLSLHRERGSATVLGASAVNETLRRSGVSELELAGACHREDALWELDLALLAALELDGQVELLSALAGRGAAGLRRLCLRLETGAWQQAEQAMDRLLTPVRLAGLRKLELLCPTANRFCQERIGRWLPEPLDQLFLWLPSLERRTLTALVQLEDALLAGVRLVPADRPDVSTATALLRTGLYEDGLCLVDVLRGVGSDTPDHVVHFQRGLLRARLGFYREAAEAYDRAIEDAPGLAVALNNRAHLAYRASRLPSPPEDPTVVRALYERTLDACRAAETPDRCHISALRWYGRLLAETEDVQAAAPSLNEAETRLEQAMTRGTISAADGQLEIALIDAVRGDHDRALAALQRLSRTDPSCLKRLRAELGHRFLKTNPRYGELAV